MLHIGIDDTDSAKQGMCTTYIAVLAREKLEKLGIVREIRLVRLNPNIKYKTRGNASVAIAIETDKVREVKEAVINIVQDNAVFSDPNTNPGLVFFEGEPEVLRDFYFRALRDIVTIEEAETIAEAEGAEYVKYKLGRGIIGALAAIGADLEEHTFEAIAYRARGNWGKPRNLDEKSVFEMDALTFPLTFNNIDHSEGKVLITPHTPCPVLFGIRGFSDKVVRNAAEMIKVDEKVEKVQIFKTNQGTDAHLQKVESIAEVRPYSSIVVEGTVIKKPWIISGGHVFFEIEDRTGILRCAAFEPTKKFRDIILRLIEGDRVVAHGGVSKKTVLTVNLEKLYVKKLVKEREVNPTCLVCRKKMESSGRGQGYRCRKCGTKAQEKVMEPFERHIEEKLYSVPPIAMRHLSKPLVKFL